MNYGCHTQSFFYLFWNRKELSNFQRKYTVSVVLIMHVLYMGQRLLKIVWRHFSSSEKPLDKCIWLNNRVEADTFMSFPYG